MVPLDSEVYLDLVAARVEAEGSNELAWIASVISKLFLKGPDDYAPYKIVDNLIVFLSLR